jgi:hypothetical protein
MKVEFISNTKQYGKEELASVIQLLADTWPNDRDNVAIAEAKFETIIDSLDQDSASLKKLLNLSWEGINYLYDKDEYFITVKTSTMQVVNLVREYVLLEGDVKDDALIQTYDKLKSSITGARESVDSMITNEELLELEEKKKKKEFSQNNKVKYLEEIIQLLESISIKDRKNVVKAGAEFEEIFDALVINSTQINKLANLTWKGLKYLYENDEFFSQVKLAVLNTVQIFKNYITENDNVKVEDFEKSYSNLEQALNGDGINDDEKLVPNHTGAISKHDIVKHDSTSIVEQNILPKNTNLDDLASYMMMLDEESITNDQKERLAAFLKNSIDKENASIISHLKEAYDIVKKALHSKKKEEGWLSIVSVKIEATTIQSKKEEWESSQDESDASFSQAKNENLSIEDGISESFYISEETDLSLISEFVTECSELIEAAEGALLDLEDHPDDDEAGKGFAVVAEEVRNLSQRSAEVAKDTSILIQKSQENTYRGTKIADEVCDNLQKIAQDFGNVSNLVAEISAAAQEQADGITQMNTMMTDMDDLIHGNASASEESASSAEELTAQADELNKIVIRLATLVGITANDRLALVNNLNSNDDVETDYSDLILSNLNKSENNRIDEVSIRRNTNPKNKTHTKIVEHELIPFAGDDFSDF